MALCYIILLYIAVVYKNKKKIISDIKTCATEDVEEGREGVAQGARMRRGGTAGLGPWATRCNVYACVF